MLTQSRLPRLGNVNRPHTNQETLLRGVVSVLYERCWRLGAHKQRLVPCLMTPEERQNLAEDPAQEGRISDLRATMDEWFVRYVAPKWDGLMLDGMVSVQTRMLP